MSLHWYACISTNTCCFEMHHISLETNWCALPNASLIVWICSAIHEILVDKAFTATDGLISQSFVVAFVHSAYMQIALIWSFPAQLSLWKSVHWLWKYKLNEVCDIFEELKEKITSQLVLSLPRRERKFRVETNASGHAIGGVLFQEQDRKWKPITFLLRTM